MATVMFGYTDGRESRMQCCSFPARSQKVLRIAEMYKVDTVWCLPLDVWEKL